MRWRKTAKVVLTVAALVPGFGPLCGDELAKRKYRDPQEVSDE